MGMRLGRFHPALAISHAACADGIPSWSPLRWRLHLQVLPGAGREALIWPAIGAGLPAPMQTTRRFHCARYMHI